MTTVEERLVVLYQDMADLTRPECATVCRVPLSCCSPEYCEMAREFARDVWGENLDSLETGHATLPFMGPADCVVAPHLRPLCTLHTCAINDMGCKPGDPEWTERYFQLRDEIEDLEARKGYSSHESR